MRVESGELRVERRLIDKEPIKKFIENGLNNPDPKKSFGYDAIEILAEIEYAPTVDAVEVVRCFECQKEGTEDCPMVYKDGITGCLCANTKGKDFCSYGERRNDNG